MREKDSVYISICFSSWLANAPKLRKGQVKWAICVQWTVCQVALAANYIIRHAVGYYDYGLLVESVASRQLVSSLAHYSLTLSPPLFAFLTYLTDSVCSWESSPVQVCCLPAVHHYCLLHVVFCGNDALMMAIVRGNIEQKKGKTTSSCLCHQGKEFCFVLRERWESSSRCKTMQIGDIALLRPPTWDRVHWQAIDDFPFSRRSTWDAINS